MSDTAIRQSCCREIYGLFGRIRTWDPSEYYYRPFLVRWESRSRVSHSLLTLSGLSDQAEDKNLIESSSSLGMISPLSSVQTQPVLPSPQLNKHLSKKFKRDGVPSLVLETRILLHTRIGLHFLRMVEDWKSFNLEVLRVEGVRLGRNKELKLASFTRAFEWTKRISRKVPFPHFHSDFDRFHFSNIPPPSLAATFFSTISLSPLPSRSAYNVFPGALSLLILFPFLFNILVAPLSILLRIFNFSCSSRNRICLLTFFLNSIPSFHNKSFLRED